jgi:hypothetical protein
MVRPLVGRRGASRASWVRRWRSGDRGLIALGAVVALIAPLAISALAQPAAASAGDISTIAGIGSAGENGDGIPGVSAAVDQPQGVAIDARGNALIADSSNNRVRVVAVSASNPGYVLAGCSGPCTWTVGDIYVIAGQGFVGYNGDGIPADAAQLDAPTGVALDRAGNPLIADSQNDRVRVIAVSASNPGYPLARWSVGDIYTIAGNGAAAVGYNGDGFYATDAHLFAPERVAVDIHGDPLITDTGNQRVRVVAVSTSNPGYPLSGCAGRCAWTPGDIYTVAGNGFGGYSGDNIRATSAELNSPTGIGVDANGDLLITDTKNHRVRIVAVSTSNPGYPLVNWTVGDIYTVAGNGTGSYTSDGIPATAAEFNEPHDVTVDAEHNPLIADTGNHRVRVLAMSLYDPGYLLAGCTGSCRWRVGDVYTLAGNGTGSYHGDDIPATSAQLNYPSGVAIDTNGNLYIADSSNSRVREVQIGTPVTVPCAPRSVSATPHKHQAEVRWKAPSCNGGPPITNYLVIPHLETTQLPARKFGATATTAVITGLTVGQTYRFTVEAINTIGTGPPSKATNAITVGVPGRPAKPTVTKTAPGSLMVSFHAPPSNGAHISRYTATCSSRNDGTTNTNSDKSSPINVDGLTPGKTYTCTVTATNSRGTGPASSPSASIVTREK